MIAIVIAPLLVAAGIAAAPAAIAHTPDCPPTGQSTMCQQPGHPSVYSGYIGPFDGTQTGGNFGGFMGTPMAPPVFGIG